MNESAGPAFSILDPGTETSPRRSSSGARGLVTPGDFSDEMLRWARETRRPP